MKGEGGRHGTLSYFSLHHFLCCFSVLSIHCFFCESERTESRAETVNQLAELILSLQPLQSDVAPLITEVITERRR